MAEQCPVKAKVESLPAGRQVRIFLHPQKRRAGRHGCMHSTANRKKEVRIFCTTQFFNKCECANDGELGLSVKQAPFC